MAPETEARTALMTALTSTYSAEAFPVRPDCLHKSLGDKGTVIGVYPERTIHAHDALVSEMKFVVQFYGEYRKEVDREQRVDPAVVEAYAERFRQTLKGGIDPKTPSVWYFMLEEIRYPIDPTNNLTRFEARVKAYGSNSALQETH